MPICAAVTKKGEKCERKAVAGSEYCWQHKESSISPYGTLRDVINWTIAELGQEDADRLLVYFRDFHPSEIDGFVEKALSKSDKDRKKFVKSFIEVEKEDELEDTLDNLATQVTFEDVLEAASKNDVTMFLFIYKIFLSHFNTLPSQQQFAFYTDKLKLDISVLRGLSYKDREDVIYNAFKIWLSSLTSLEFEALIRSLFDLEENLITSPIPDFYTLIP